MLLSADAILVIFFASVNLFVAEDGVWHIQCQPEVEIVVYISLKSFLHSIFMTLVYCPIFLTIYLELKVKLQFLTK